MRLLDQKKIVYSPLSFETEEARSGVEAAALMGLKTEEVYKTLVTTGHSGRHYVFVIPVEKELELKKAAKAAGEKSIEMLKAKDLLPLTGYVHGGCSPVGMKKLFPTFLDDSAGTQPAIVISAGKIGYHVRLAAAELGKVIPLRYAELC